MNKIHTSTSRSTNTAGRATTATTPKATRRNAGAAAPSSAIKRIYSISRAEVLLFVRNPTILLTALLLPVVMVAMLAPTLGSVMEGAAFGSFIVQTLAVWALLLIVYVNLTTIFVSRREDGVFQRMSTGEASPWEGMIAASVPSVVVTLVQVTLGVVGTLVLVEGTVVNPLLILAAVLGASVFLGGVSAWTSRYTSTVEGAQFSTMPVLMVLLFTSGSLIPVSVLPEMLAQLSEWTPFYAVNELIGIGMTGAGGAGIDAVATQVTGSFLDSWVTAAQPLAALAIWAVLGVEIARRTMRFAPRR
ncbi:MAG: ABC transporter permease [Ancrocorticia sp.]